MNIHQSILLVVILLSQTHCQTSKENKRDVIDSTLLIFNDKNYSSVQKYIDSIKVLPEYIKWEKLHPTSDTKERYEYLSFDYRRVLYNNNLYYHIELYKNRSNMLYDSYISQPIVICYFRVDSSLGSIKILDQNSKQFLNLFSDSGRSYFKYCLRN